MITPTVSLDPRSVREILPPVPPFPKDQIARRTIPSPSPRRRSPFSPPHLHLQQHQRQHQRRHSHHRQNSHSHSYPQKHQHHQHEEIQQTQEQQQALTHEALKTSREQAKLDRRRYEHAMLRDALRRGVPYLYIPGLLARGNQTPEATSPAGSGSSPRNEHISVSTGHPPRNIDLMTNPNGNFNQTHNVISPGNHGHGIENIHLNENGNGNGKESMNAPPPVRRLNLDDSFLRRAYKRRRSWGATAKGRAAAESQHQRGRSSGQISFHHWVPRGSEQKV